MTESLHAGPKGEPLPEGVIVFRFARTSKDYPLTGLVSPVAFELSPSDKEADPPTLTIWCEHLTTVQQAREFMSLDSTPYDLVCPMNVDGIRILRPEPDAPEVPYLDVIWVPLTEQEDGIEVPDEREGADGHAGITNLNRPSAMPRIYYKSLRSKLAELASKSACLISTLEQS